MWAWFRGLQNIDHALAGAGHIRQQFIKVKQQPHVSAKSNYITS